MLNNFTMVDLSQPLHDDCPTWNGSCGFDIRCKSEPTDEFQVQEILMQAGIGTHIDAPYHYKGSKKIDELPLNKFIAKAYVIDVSSIADEYFVFSLKELFDFEKKFGAIESDTIVIIHTGWCNYWSNPKKYRNEKQNGHMQYPSVSPDVAKELLKRKIAALGIDTLSPDLPNSQFLVHEILLSNEIMIIENVNHANVLPPIGAYVSALPLKIVGGTESPIRLVGFLKAQL